MRIYIEFAADTGTQVWGRSGATGQGRAGARACGRMRTCLELTCVLVGGDGGDPRRTNATDASKDCQRLELEARAGWT